MQSWGVGQTTLEIRKIFSAAWGDGDQRRRVVDPMNTMRHPVVRWSVWGLIAVYNMLPYALLRMRKIPEFQSGLQHPVVQHAKAGRNAWLLHVVTHFHQECRWRGTHLQDDDSELDIIRCWLADIADC